MSRLVPRLAGLALPAVAALSFASAAQAAPQNGPSGNAFYTPPTNVPTSGTPGELLRYRGVAKNLGSGTPNSYGYDIMYRSTDSNGTPNVVTGTVFIPKAAYAGGGTRPTVGYAFGTQGLAPQCAPSKQMGAGTEYESPNIIAALQRGYAVVGSDYAGYTDGSHPSYIAGASEGHAVLDALKAASQIPNGGLISASSPTAIWGYSQGGQAASFAAQQAASYAPGIKLAGVATGGIPGDLTATAKYLNGSAGASFLLQAVVGLSQEYPTQIPFNSLANAAGQAARTDAQTNLCVFGALNKYINKNISQFTANNQTLDQLLAIPSVKSAIDAQKLGTVAPSVPIFQYHGAADEFIPLQQAYQLKKDWCAKGVSDQFTLYPSEHLTTLFQAAPAALTWITDRFNGKAPSSTCNTGLGDPVSTANPGGGDFIVSLPDWTLSGTAHLAKLNQNLTLPAGATFDGSANLTSRLLSGAIDIPSFTTTIDIAGIKILTSLTLTPTGNTQGTVTLDDNGQLHIKAEAPVVIHINSLTAGPIKLGTNCRTQSTVHIPLSFDGPVSSLGTGSLTFNTAATIPPLTDCGVYGPVLSALIAGGGNGFYLTLTPPAPKSW
ncbi:MAG: lipase family protein [Solirubrobacteraceae bacterium]|nr:lipase family protein [Patulibacter sp.]